MNKVFNAKIKWLTEKQGGRKNIPSGDSYGPIVIVKDVLLNQNNEKWSLWVNNKKILNNNESLAEVSYLSEQAPANLYRDVKFELYEGTRLVANGIIL